MNPDLIDALIDMFNDFSQSEQTESLITSSDSIHEALLDSGFNTKEINLAISWLEAFAIGNTEQDVIKAKRPNSYRVLNPKETQYLSSEAMGYLQEKYKNNALSSDQLEFILDQISMIGKDEIGVDKMAWIYHMTLLNFQENESSLKNESDEKDPFSYLPTHIQDHYLHYIH
jgi:uncharacterized protein Smg (DUF494 family)